MAQHGRNGRRDGSPDGYADRTVYPLWVRAATWGTPGRAGLWGFALIAVVAASSCAAYAARSGSDRWYAGLGFLLAALAYWRAIRWIDRRGW